MGEYKGQASVHIQAPVESVYRYLADFTRHPEWAKNLGKVTQLTAGPAGVGTTFKTSEGPPPVSPSQKVRMTFYVLLGMLSGTKPYSKATITALEPPRRIAWQAGMPKGSGFFNYAEWEFQLEPQDGGTELTQHFHWQPQSATANRMVGVAGVAGLQEAVSVSLAALKQRLEAQPAPVPDR